MLVANVEPLRSVTGHGIPLRPNVTIQSVSSQKKHMPTQAPNPVLTRSDPSPTVDSVPVKDPQRTRLALMFGLFVLAATLLFWRQLAMMATLWVSDGDESIGALVPMVSAYFAWRAWKKTETLPARPAISGFVLAVAIALGVIALNFGDRNGATLCEFLIPIFLAGCMASLAGWRFVRQFTFPLLFLWFLMPVPPPVLSVVDYPLQLLCARFLEGMAHLLHLPVVRSGTMVGPNLDTAVTIAPACNGIRSSITLVMLTIVFARLRNLRFFPGMLLVIAAIPLAYAANFFRLSGLFFLITVFGERFMPYEHYADLISGALWFFAAVLIMISMAQRFTPHRRIEQVR